MGPIGFAGVMSLPYNELGGLWHFDPLVDIVAGRYNQFPTYQKLEIFKTSQGTWPSWFFCAKDVSNCTAWRSMTYVWPMDICQMVSGHKFEATPRFQERGLLARDDGVIAFDHVCLDLRTSEFAGSFLRVPHFRGPQSSTAEICKSLTKRKAKLCGAKKTLGELQLPRATTWQMHQRDNPRECQISNPWDWAPKVPWTVGTNWQKGPFGPSTKKTLHNIGLNPIYIEGSTPRETNITWK